jgi:cytochrome c peroxidase
VLNRLATSRFEDVHWGSLLSNHLRVLRLDSVLAPGTDRDLLESSRLVDLGDVGHAAGDPAAALFDREGRLIVALAGVNEVGIASGTGAPMRRTPVGYRPTALAIGPDNTELYVANTSDDTISIVTLRSGVPVKTVRLGPRPESTLVARGEALFHDARLSRHGWMSCHSCHIDGHSNGLTADTLGDGTYGAPKRVPSLLGVGATGPWGWNGSIDALEDQVRKSVETTMRGSAISHEDVEALTAYLRSLEPPAPARTGVAPEAAAVERGRESFRSRGCAECHAPPEYTALDARRCSMTRGPKRSKMSSERITTLGARSCPPTRSPIFVPF